MAKMKLKLEVWKSSKGNREDHYFESKSNDYVFGYNPKYFSENAIHVIKKYLDDHPSPFDEL